MPNAPLPRPKAEPSRPDASAVDPAFQDRTIAVTGATRGIGRALVDGLVRRGAGRILAVARDAAALDALAASHPGRVEPFPADLSDRTQVIALARTLSAAAPDLGILINNAGTQMLSDLVSPNAGLLAGSLATEIDLNFTGQVVLCCELLPLLVAQPSAMLVNITSGLALAPKQSSPVYCATKAAMRHFSTALRYQAEARAPGLRVIEALPPLVDTDMTAGRGYGKISAEACAAEILAGMAAGRSHIYVGKSKLLRAIHACSPALAMRIMRDG